MMFMGIYVRNHFCSSIISWGVVNIIKIWGFPEDIGEKSCLVDDFSLSLKKKRFSPSNYRDIDGYGYDGYDGWLMISFCGVFRGTTWYYPSTKNIHELGISV